MNITPEKWLQNALLDIQEGEMSPSIETARRLIEELDAAGYVIVPKVPTVEMCEAAIRAPLEGRWPTWDAMLVAAKGES